MRDGCIVPSFACRDRRPLTVRFAEPSSLTVGAIIDRPQPDFVTRKKRKRILRLRICDAALRMTRFWLVISNHRAFSVILSDQREPKDPQPQ